MKVVGVIPARFGSTRLPGKPLVKIHGKPLLQWVIEGARSSEYVSDIFVATDHPEIASLAESLGVVAMMTDSDLPSGSDRVWAAIQDKDVEVVLNIQGDEPLITGELLDELVVPFTKDPQIEMATLARKSEPGDLESLHSAKIVVNHKGEALYFSRHPIPFSRIKKTQEVGDLDLIHIGIYAYKKNFLQKFCAQGPVQLELAEGLEQLRALYLGAKIKVVQVEHHSFGVDTPEDVKKMGEILGARNGS